jgi:hypothetical protein
MLDGYPKCSATILHKHPAAMQLWQNENMIEHGRTFNISILY